MEPSPALLRLVARAQYRHHCRTDHMLGISEPAPWQLDEAGHLLEALDAEGLEIRPKELGDDLTASEEGA